MALAFAEAVLAKHPGWLAKLHRLRSKIHAPAGTLKVTMATSPEPVPFADRLGLDYRPVRGGVRWGKAFTCAWFHVATDAVPTGLPHLAVILDIDGEALVRDASGAVVGAVSSRTTPIEEIGVVRGKTRLDVAPLLGDGRLDLWLDAGFNGKLMPPFGAARIRRLALVSVRDDVEALYYDTVTCVLALLAAPDEARADRYRQALVASERVLGRATPADVAAAREALVGVLHGTPDADLAVTAVGHGHLDLAWLWPIRETRRKAERTLTHQLANLDAHPAARYGVSQPQQLAWLAEQAPELFARTIDAMKQGRIEPQGGMWVEPDTNLPSGESLVRQVLYGQRFWSQYVGRRPDFCWLPDVFGYSGALPQILRKGGMSRFLTIKLSWNEHNDFPYRSFRWRGIDGSEVLVHMPPEGTYNSSASPLALQMLRDNYPEADAAGEALLVYGSGDGGGGPGPAHLEGLERLASLEGYPAVRHGTAGEFFDRLEARAEHLPTWQGELYLEKHQGTYTTQGAIKKGNRLLEHRLHDVEYLAALAWAQGRPYPADLLERAWKTVLLHQFHDILPGSSITRVNVEARQTYAELDAELVAEQSALLADRAPGASSFVNTLSTRRFGHVRTDDGWFTYDAQPFGTVPLTPSVRGGVRAEGDVLANEHLEVRFTADGLIGSLVDRASGRDHAGQGLNRLVVHPDPWSYFDAWDINMSYLTARATELRPVHVETFVDGPRAVRRQRYRHGRTTLVQEIEVRQGVPYVLITTDVDWHERWKMLRAEFRPTAWSDEVTCQIQFGHLARTTRDETSVERAQFEVCAHQWVDVSDADGGLSLLNDGKYGHRAKEGLLSLNLLRSPIYPDPEADQGRHTFRYALYPHAGAVTQADTEAWAADLNAPVVIAPVAAAEPPFGAEGVRLDTVKVAEDGRALILRAHEPNGRHTRASIAVRLPVAGVTEVDLLEEGGRPVDLADVAFGPFEIKTVRVELRG